LLKDALLHPPNAIKAGDVRRTQQRRTPSRNADTQAHVAAAA
jgi:hypothetical protein